jgi:predicted nuclease with TOPRIM domain
MAATELKNQLERVRTWPEEAQNELVAVANQIESELQGDYVASREELKAIDEAIASLEAGESASDGEIQATFAKFRST